MSTIRINVKTRADHFTASVYCGGTVIGHGMGRSYDLAVREARRDTQASREARHEMERACELTEHLRERHEQHAADVAMGK